MVTVNILGFVIFELCCGQTDIQINKQTDSNILPTPTDSVGLDNNNML